MILGFLTFTGSLMAAGKLQEIVPTRPITYREPEPRQPVAARASRSSLGVYLVDRPDCWPAVRGRSSCCRCVFGVLLIIPIGGADMPTVISLLNSYAGLSAVAMGFVLENKLLIIAGALDGSSGLILSIIMCKAMNRSFTNVLFGAFGQVQAAAAGGRGEDGQERARRRTSPTSSTNADRVVIIPGYGMAVAQAQHRVRELYDQLTKRGIDVKFAIHPVAGRMPGHMNVLLAEAEIPYDALVEMDDINPEMPQTDVALVVGANDVVNPAARHDKSSPIFGMPIIDADKAKTVHRDQALDEPGLRGHRERALLRRQHADAFGDAKQVLGDVVKAISGEGVAAAH